MPAKKLVVTLPAALFKRLTRAAEKREMPPQQLVVEIVRSSTLADSAPRNRPRSEREAERRKICEYVRRHPGCYASDIRVGAKWQRPEGSLGVYLKRYVEAGYLRAEGARSHMKYYRTKMKLG